MKVEGRNSVYELLSSTKTVDKILVQNGLRDAPSRELISAIKESGIKFTFTEKSVLDKESATKKHQGFIAYVTDFEYSDLDDVLDAKKYIGRAPAQTVEFIQNEIQPILDKHAEYLGAKGDVRV